MPVQPLSRATHRRLAPLAAGGPQHDRSHRSCQEPNGDISVVRGESACRSRVRRNGGSSRNCSSKARSPIRPSRNGIARRGAGSYPSGLDPRRSGPRASRLERGAPRGRSDARRRAGGPSVAARPHGQRDVIERFRRTEPADIVDNRRQQRLRRQLPNFSPASLNDSVMPSV